MKPHGYRLNKRERRHARVRSRVSGRPERPRLSVFRSGKHIYAQLIDDRSQITLGAVNDLVLSKNQQDKTARARAVGEAIAKAALARKIKYVAFDRGAYLYAGRVRALAEAARAGGLEF